MMKIVNVSPHLLMDVIACQSKAWTRHIKGLTSEGEAIRAVAGQAIHAGIAAFLQPEPQRADFTPIDDPAGVYRRNDPLGAFHNIYDPNWATIDAAKLDVSLTPQNLERLLSRWIETHPPAACPWSRVLEVEKSFVSREWIFRSDFTTAAIVTNGVSQVDPGEGFYRVRLIVRPDALVLDAKSGKVRWLDTKTTGWHISDDGWKADLRLSFQAQLYSDAIAQRFGAEAQYAGWFNAMELRKLPGEADANATPKLKKDGTPAKERLCQDHGKPYRLCGIEHLKTEFVECLTTAERVERAVLDAENAAREFAQMVAEAESGKSDEEIVPTLDMRGTAKGVCRFCSGKGWCEDSRPAAEGALGGFFIYSPYLVEEGDRA